MPGAIKHAMNFTNKNTLELYMPAYAVRYHTAPRLAPPPHPAAATLQPQKPPTLSTPPHHSHPLTLSPSDGHTHASRDALHLALHRRLPLTIT